LVLFSEKVIIEPPHKGSENQYSEKGENQPFKQNSKAKKTLRKRQAFGHFYDIHKNSKEDSVLYALS